MSDLNNTVSSASLVVAASTVADKNSDGSANKIRTLSATVLRDALRAVKNNEESNFAFVTSIVAMTIDAISRNMHDKLPLGNDPKPDARRQVPSSVTSTHSKVMRELKVSMVLAGRSPFSNAAEGVARILALPRDSQQQRNIRRAQAEKLVDAPLFHNGFPVGPFKGNLVPAEYAGAEAKANNESMKLGNKYSGFIIDWFWNNSNETIQTFANRVAADHVDGAPTPFIDLTVEDLQVIRNIIRETFGDTMTELESSYRAGRPVKESRSRMDTIKNTFAKLSHGEMVDFLQWAQSKQAEVARGDANVKAATTIAQSDSDIDDVLNDTIVEFAAARAA